MTRAEIVSRLRPSYVMSSARRRRRAFALLLLSPAAILWLLIVAAPIARNVWISFQRYDLLSPETLNQFVGLEHYSAMVSDPQFWDATTATLIYTGATTVLAYVCGLGLALLLSRPRRGVGVVRSLLSAPWAIPGVVGGFIFVWLFDVNFGVMNELWTSLGGDRILWLLRPGSAMLVIIVAAVWKTMPFNMLVHVAGMKAIPGELYEAAHVDGASAWQRFRYITWPGLVYVRVVAILLTGVHSFREFGQIFVITGGGPSRATETLSVQIYLEAFSYFQFGYAAAIGIALLAISLVFAVLVARTMRAEFF